MMLGHLKDITAKIEQKSNKNNQQINKWTVQVSLFIDWPLISTEMKQNSTKNMILSHLEDIKAKIKRKSSHNMKLPFEGPFKNKYTGRSPERISCLYSVRLVFLC